MKIIGKQKKHVLDLFSICITAGFITGCVWATYTVFIRRYFACELYLLSASTYQDCFNAGIIAALFSCLIAAILVICAAGITRIVSIENRRETVFKVLAVLFLCITACVWGIYTVHQNWLHLAPGKYHPKIFAYDAFIVAVLLLFGWLSLKINLSRLLVRIGPVFRICAVFAFVATVMMNAALAIHGAYFLPDRPNVILISIDALRADHVGCYGYHRNTTPNIDAFARESILFKNAFAHDAWTLPSHMSMLTGLYSMTHGVGANFTNPLPYGVLTFAELMKNAGYRTLGFANGVFWMMPHYGFERGFDYYNLSLLYNPDIPERNAEYQNKFIQRQLQSRKKKNNFIFIHYFDVHSAADYLPYDAPAPYSNLFTDKDFDLFADAEHDYRATAYLGYLNSEKVMPDTEKLEHIIGLYDNGIAYMDKYIGDLFAILKEEGLYDNSIIIITADHGEAFGEHGYFSHDNYCHDEEIHVPLIMQLPVALHAEGATVFEGLVEITDLVPTILDYLSIPSSPMDGISLRPAINGSMNPEKYIYGLTSRTVWFIRSKKWKLVGEDGLDRGLYRLHDLEIDPGEHYNVVNDHPEIEDYLEEKLRQRILESLELRMRLTGTKETVRDTDKIQLDDAQKEHLRSLGYVL